MSKKENFGSNFKWGITISAFQNEGASNKDGKGDSIWDTFTNNVSNIKNRDEIHEATDFYTRYEEDIKTTKELGFDVFRFSISWPRILPQGFGRINNKGIEFYNKVIDTCLKYNLEPWVTLYHWDLPQHIEDIGGWTNRETIDYFKIYTQICTNSFGDRVKNWIVMNEPMTFTGLGYFMGYHAPKRTGVPTFIKAAHHVVLAMAEGGRTIRKLYPEANIGVSLSCSHVTPVNKKPKNIRAAKRLEALLNRFFLEPLLGLGYPIDTIPMLNFIKSYYQPGDEERMSFDFDFIGIQYYFKVVAQHSLTPPVLFAEEVPPTQRKAKLNAMNLEVYPKGLYKMIEYYKQYPQIKNLIITESGVCYPDHKASNHIHDVRRMKYHKKMLKQIRKAQRRNLNVSGYFVWTLVDNFEWKEGYEPRFGLVYNDHITQKRTIKYSGLWFKKFLCRQ